MTKTLHALASWDSTRQTRYHQRAGMPQLHFLLDQSGSMDVCVRELLTAYNRLIGELQSLLPPLTTVETWGFHRVSTKLLAGPLGTLPPLTEADYKPQGGTWLVHAIELLLTATESPGQHILIVFTDGEDTEDLPSRVKTVKALMTRKQQDDGWLCIYLGAYHEALAQGRACGFVEGNCLTFALAHLAEAFTTLRQGMQRFVTAPAAQRQRLLTTGVFSSHC